MEKPFFTKVKNDHEMTVEDLEVLEKHKEDLIEFAIKERGVANGSSNITKWKNALHNGYKRHKKWEKEKEVEILLLKNQANGFNQY